MAWAASRRARQWLGLAALTAVMAGYSSISTWQRDHAFMINASESLPNWAFSVDRSVSPARGDYVFFAPPENELIRTHFGPDSGPFGKQVIGMPGDFVSHDGRVVRVNGSRVATMKPRARTGEALTPGPVGEVPNGCFYVGTSHPDGLDSRYAEVGFVCRRQIVGVGSPIL